MTTDGRSYVRAENGLRLLPMPGTHQCITVQANITLYPPAGTSRYVIVMRDPSMEYELQRQIGPMGDVLPTNENFVNDLTLMVRDAVDLGGMHPRR